MKHLKFFSFIISIIFFTVLSICLYAQDSTALKYPQKIILKGGTELFGKIVKQDSLFVQIQLNDGKLIKVPKKAIESSRSISNEFKKIALNQDISLNLYDGTQLNGRIISVNDSSLVFKTLSGVEMTIPLSLIDISRELKGEVINGIYYRKDPNQSHLFLAPTAQPIEAGKVNFTDYMIFFPSLTVGITDFMSVGVGVSIFPGSQSQLLYGNIKITFLNKTFGENNLCLAAGATFANYSSMDLPGTSLLYGLATFSRNPFAVTLGFIGADNHNGNIFLFGGELRVSNSIKIISEDYYNPQNNVGVYSLGFRFFSDKIAGDIGLFYYNQWSDNIGFPFIPWLGFTYSF